MDTLPLARWLLGAARGLRDLALPPHCPGCASMLPPGQTWCGPCQETLTPVEPAGCCPVCADLVGPQRCGRCTSRPPPFAQVHAGLVWGGAVRDAVHRLKFSGAAWVAPALVHAAFPSARPAWAELDALVALPLHPRRQRERGYNQAHLLARELSHLAGRPVLRGVLRRAKATLPAATLDPEAREAAVRDAFAAPRPGALRGLHVGLVDDVLTTSATARAAATVLREAGATKVTVIAVARGGHGPG